MASSDAAAEASTAKGKKKAAVTSIVEHILYKDQIKHLKSANLWYALIVCSGLAEHARMNHC